MQLAEEGRLNLKVHWIRVMGFVANGYLEVRNVPLVRTDCAICLHSKGSKKHGFLFCRRTKLIIADYAKLMVTNNTKLIITQNDHQLVLQVYLENLL